MEPEYPAAYRSHRSRSTNRDFNGSADYCRGTAPPAQRLHSTSPSPSRYTERTSSDTERKAVSSRRPRRSLTVSPQPENDVLEEEYRRRRKKYLTVQRPQRISDPWNFGSDRERIAGNRSVSPAPHKSAAEVQKKPALPRFARRSLRKTCSEPNEVYNEERERVEQIQDILKTLNFARFHLGSRPISPSTSQKSYATCDSEGIVGSPPDDGWGTPSSDFVRSRAQSTNQRRVSTPSDSEFICTDIEELKEAAYSIEALSRLSGRAYKKRKIGSQPPNNISPVKISPRGDDSRESTPEVLTPTTTAAPASISEEIQFPNCQTSTGTLTRRSGISTRSLGHPRGVMQFIPSVKSSDFFAKRESYLANKSRRSRSSMDSQDAMDAWSDESHSPTTTLLRPRDSAQSLGYSSMGPSMSGSMHESVSYSGLSNMAQHRRKISVPDDAIHYISSVRPEVDGFSRLPTISGAPIVIVPPDVARRKSTSAAPINRKVSSTIVVNPPPQSPQQRGVARFGSFSQFSPTRQRRLVTRQYSQSDKHNFSDTEAIESSFSRFGRLLKSLRHSKEGSPELDVLSPASSDSPLSSPVPSDFSGPATTHLTHVKTSFELGQNLSALPVLRSKSTTAAPAMSDSESSMKQADAFIWRRRSKGSLRKHEDTRSHVVKELFDTEASYVESLQLLVHKYLRPLKGPELLRLIEPALVDEIFFQIPEILGHHELFYAALKSRLDNWDNKQKIGDLILNNFTKQSVIDTYTSFINNWKNAKQAIRSASQAKPSFAKYLERCSREHKNKLTLDALLIMPVQRIPRYELLIKELLKHTSVEHPDYALLVRAQGEIHTLATKINKVEAEAGLMQQMQQRLREIEAIVDGLDDLVSTERVFYRYDLVTVSTHLGRKERCMFLFSDQLIICSIKRKSSTGLGRKVSGVSSPSHQNFLENHKFKLLMKISLDDLEVTKNSLPMLSKLQDELSQLQEDLRILGKISELFTLLRFPHEDVDKNVDGLKSSVRQQMNERQHEMTTNPVLTSLDLLVTTEEGLETLVVVFHSADKRVAWEKCFNEAKETLALSLSRRPPPVFYKTVAIQKTRAGVALSCAAATLGRNEFGFPNVWVCNTDGYVGQVCLLRLTPEPDLTSCNGVTNSRILSICAVPDYKHSGGPRRSRPGSKKEVKESNPHIDTEPKLELDSDSSENDNTDNDTRHGRIVVNGTAANTNAKIAVNCGETQPTKRLGPNDSVDDTEDLVPTMWLGTEDGSILIYNFNDNVRTRRNKAKIKHEAPAQAIVCFDDKIFIALGNLQVVVYSRDSDGAWDLEKFQTLHFEDCEQPIAHMAQVTNKLWCCSQNKILVLNPATLELEHWFFVCADDESQVSCLAVGGLAVWIGLLGSPVVKLFHALSYECLLEVNVAPSVTKMLAGTDDIIRQHKLGRLRVTALLCCKDLLWVGTSAGVILQMQLPHLTPNSGKLSSTPILSSLPVGHVGQCRLLISADLQAQTISRSNSGHTGFTAVHYDLSKRRQSLNVAAIQQGKMYVISGGDGFQDFQDNEIDDADETVPRLDSTNYLLMWEA